MESYDEPSPTGLYRVPVIPVSARAGRNFYVLKESIFHALDIICIYTKVPGKEPDLAEPL